MKKILLLGAALGLALAAMQTPNAMGAEDKKESAFEWGYWNSGIAPAAGPVALNIDPITAGIPDYKPDPDPKPPEEIPEPKLRPVPLPTAPDPIPPPPNNGPGTGPVPVR